MSLDHQQLLPFDAIDQVLRDLAELYQTKVGMILRRAVKTGSEIGLAVGFLLYLGFQVDCQ